MANGDKLHEGVEIAETAVARTVTDGFAQARLTVEHGLHGAVLGEYIVLGGTVQVHFAVKVVAVQSLRSRMEIVVSVAGQRWRGKEGNDFRGDCIYGDRGLIGKRLSPGTVGIACRGIVDSGSGADKVPGAHSCSGHSDQTRAAIIALEGPVPTSEEEQLV